MENYIISCCSTLDLPKEYLESRDIKYVFFHYHLNGETYSDDLYTSITPQEFFKMILEGAEPTTSQMAPGEYEEMWREYLDKGMDILHITLSSGISGTYQSAVIARDELKEEYPDRKIIVIDSLAASSGYGLLVDKAYENKQSGMDIEENAKWIEENKNKLHHWFFSSDLTSFIRGGRVSKASGFFGTVLNICPLLKVNSEGKLIPQIKCRGKQKAIKEACGKMISHAQGGRKYNQKVFLSHSNCYDDATKLADMISDNFSNIDGEIMINNIGTVIGSHTGQGTVALFFWGDERTE